MIGSPRLARLISPHFIDWVQAFLADAEKISIHESLSVCRDPKDNKFLELAVCGRADVLVTGDKDLLTLNPFHDIPIVLPAIFIRAQKL